MQPLHTRIHQERKLVGLIGCSQTFFVIEVGGGYAFETECYCVAVWSQTCNIPHPSAFLVQGSHTTMPSLLMWC